MAPYIPIKISGMDKGLLTDQEIAPFRLQLLSWFRKVARDLPWRHTHDPYRIWVSEVMLQQTRVATVIDRYEQFTRRFPSLVSLALAREEDVLALWSGLGYYKRARMLHSAAQLLVNEHGGSLPKRSVELRRLPGVGDYTAAAIASIAHGEPVAVVDGNVERVLIRLLGMGTPSNRLSATRLKEAAARLLDPTAPGMFNQAMMELGATVCLPRLPLCPECPVLEFCKTRGEHVARPRKQMSSRKMNYALIRRQLGTGWKQVEVFLIRRPPTASQMPGMWELPLLPPADDIGREPILRIRHAITNTNYYVAVFAQLEDPHPIQSGDSIESAWVPDRKLGEIALTGLARKILMRLDVMAKPRQVRQGKALPGGEDEFV
jgi:A/G-specific adenine glycosylase